MLNSAYTYKPILKTGIQARPCGAFPKAERTPTSPTSCLKNSFILLGLPIGPKSKFNHLFSSVQLLSRV